MTTEAFFVPRFFLSETTLGSLDLGFKPWADNCEDFYQTGTLLPADS